MPDEDDFDDQGSDQDSSVVRTLRKQLAAAEKDAAEAPELRKKLALADAGLGSLKDSQKKALIAAHEGDMTPEALKATALDLGFTAEAPAAADPDGVSVDERAAHQRLQDAGAGADPVGGQSKTLDDELNAAKSPAEIVSILERENMRSDAQ